MKSLHHPARPHHQINARLTEAEMLELMDICEREDRGRSYLVRWFIRWGMEQYERIGSLAALKSTKIITDAQHVIEREVKEATGERLQLRKEAETSYGNEGQGAIGKRKARASGKAT